MNKFIITILWCTTLIACNSNKDKIGKVKSMYDILESAEEIVEQVDTGEAFSAHREIKQKLLFIQKNYPDTIDKPSALFIGDVHSMRKILTHFKESREEFEEEIEYSKEQLEDMISDLEENKMPADKFNEYYQTEMDAILDLNTRVQRATNNTLNSLEKYKDGKAKLDSIINGIKAAIDTTQT